MSDVFTGPPQEVRISARFISQRVEGNAQLLVVALGNDRGDEGVVEVKVSGTVAARYAGLHEQVARALERLANGGVAYPVEKALQRMLIEADVLGPFRAFGGADELHVSPPADLTAEQVERLLAA